MRVTSLILYYEKIIIPRYFRLPQEASPLPQAEKRWCEGHLLFGSVAKEAQPRHKPKSLSGGGCLCQSDPQVLVDKGLSWMFSGVVMICLRVYSLYKYPMQAILLLSNRILSSYE
jgi:hypothetical protein